MKFKLSDVKYFPSIRAVEGNYRVVLTFKNNTTITRDIGREEIILKLFGEMIDKEATTDE